MGCYRLLPVCYVLLICGLSSGQMGLEKTPLASEAARSRLALQKLLVHQLTSEDILRLGMNGTVISSRKYDGLKEPCKSHMDFYEYSFNTAQPWAMYMYDASTKIPESVLMGAVTHMGNYDECVEVRDVTPPDGNTFHGQYCMAAVIISPKMPSKTMLSAGGVPPLTLAACVPSTCDAEDTQIIVENDFTERMKTESQLFNLVNVVAIVMGCETTREVELDGRDWAITGILIVVGVLVILSTAYDVLTLHSESRINLLLAFSVYTNGSKLFAISTSRSGNTIHCLHGIRFFSMAWVILGHRYGTGAYIPSINAARFTEDIYTDFKYVWITNGGVSVDTFLVLSGLLVGYTFFLKVPKTNSFNVPMYYIHRFIRLTPALAIVIFLQVSLLRHSGSGPMASQIETAIGKNCEETWWATLFYVQNYVDKALKAPCLQQAWYLSLDMQLFWVSPLVLIPLWKWPKIGLYFSGALSIGGIISNFVISFVNEFSGTQGGANVRGDDFGKKLYNPSHARFVPYLLGILLGYLLVSLKSRNITVKFSKLVTLLLWLVTGGVLLLTLCIIQVFQEPGYEFDNFSAALHNALMRPGWGLGVAMVIFLCHTGHGGVIDSFLSWAWFQPLSRLCYCVYLLHLSVVSVQMGNAHSLSYLSNDNLMRLFIGDLIISLLFGIVLSLTFESPFLVLERELLGGGKKKTNATTEPFAVTSVPEQPQDVSAQVPKEKLDV